MELIYFVIGIIIGFVLGFIIGRAFQNGVDSYYKNDATAQNKNVNLLPVKSTIRHQHIVSADVNKTKVPSTKFKQIG